MIGGQFCIKSKCLNIVHMSFFLLPAQEKSGQEENKFTAAFPTFMVQLCARCSLASIHASFSSGQVKPSQVGVYIHFKIMFPQVHGATGPQRTKTEHRKTTPVQAGQD